MENRAKFLIIGLIGFLLLSVIVSLQTYTTKLNLQKEIEKLALDKQTLTQKIDETQQKTKILEDKFGTLNKELEKLNKEKEDFQKKFDLLNREKSELIDRLKNQRSAAAAQEAGASGAPASSVPSGKDEAYWGGILKAKTDLEMQLTSLRSEFKTAQINNEQIQREKNALELDLTAFKREKEDLQRQVEYNKKLLDSIAQELVREKNDKIQIQESIKTLKSENEVLIRQVKSLSSRRYSLEQKVQELQEGKIAIERRFNEMEDKLSQKVSMIGGLKDELEVIRSGADAEVQEKQETAFVNKGPVELAPIVVRPSGASEGQVRIQEGTTLTGGKVLAINRESNFVIVDLGEDAGVKIGDSFKVIRVDKAIALLEVIQTRKNISACDIKNEIVPIKIGDSVR